MNIYLADQIAREHADRMMADAVLARRVRQVRASRRARSRVVAAQARPNTRVGQLVSRPYRALHTWLAAGLL